MLYTATIKKNIIVTLEAVYIASVKNRRFVSFVRLLFQV